MDMRLGLCRQEAQDCTAQPPSGESAARCGAANNAFAPAGVIGAAPPKAHDSARAIYRRGEVDLEDVTTSAIDVRIHSVRGTAVMLDSDLAALYQVSVKALLQAVRRNRKRFPADFMFPLSAQEVTRLRSQIVTSKPVEGRGGRRYQLHAFTEQGVAMLSSVLRSEAAVRVNIEIMRAFVRLRRAAIASEQVMALVEDLS
jgi:hypothetical protein